MKTDFNHEKLNGLLSDFYAVTGQRIGIFDVDFHVVLEYPKKHSSFCSKIRESNDGARRCRECDTYGMREAKKTGKTVTYQCHAGLLEVCSPILDEDGITGYLMFGQVLNDRNIGQQRAAVWQKCSDILPDYAYFTYLFDDVRKIPSDYLNAVANIMNACVGYIRLEQFMKLRHDGLWGQMKHYIERQSDRSFSLAEMASDLSVSVSTLCKAAKAHTDKTVVQLVIEQRMQRAKHLLANDNLSISNVASLVGIEDYNYFSRLFRKETGVSPTNYRKDLKKTKES